MKIAIKFILTLFVTSIIFYLVGAFIACDFNPHYWDVEGRVLTAFLSVSACIIYRGIYDFPS